MDIALGRKLKASRIEAGMDTPGDIAAKVGRSSRQVQNYENGVVPPADVLLKWAQAVGKPVEYFLPQKAQAVREDETLPKMIHRGIEELASDPELVARLGLTMEAVESARHFLAFGSNGQPVEIDNLTDAVEIVRVLQRHQPPRAGRDGSVSVTAAKADALTWQVLRDLIGEGALRDAAQAGQRRAKKTAQSDRVKTLQAEHDDLGKKIAFAYRAQVDGGLDMATLLEVNKPLVARREKIERELQGIRSPEPLPEVFSLTAATLDKLIGGADIERQRNLLLSVFERVEIHPDRLRYVPRLPDLQALEVAIPRYYAPARGGRLNVCYL